MSKPDERMGIMTLREFAAVRLCVPDSGTDWLDAMIIRAQRDKFAGQALEGLFSDPDSGSTTSIAEVAYEVANAMLKARDK